MDEPKPAGSKSVIKLTMENTFAEKIESARVTIFLFADDGKMVGQSTKWVIGGTQDRPALEPDKETTFNFVIETEKPFTQTKLIFTRVILEGGKLVDVNADVKIEGLNR